MKSLGVQKGKTVNEGTTLDVKLRSASIGLSLLGFSSIGIMGMMSGAQNSPDSFMMMLGRVMILLSLCGFSLIILMIIAIRSKRLTSQVIVAVALLLYGLWFVYLLIFPRPYFILCSGVYALPVLIPLWLAVRMIEQKPILVPQWVTVLILKCRKPKKTTHEECKKTREGC